MPEKKFSPAFLREHWRCHLNVCVEGESKGRKYEEIGPHLSSTFLPSLALGWWGTALRRPVQATGVLVLALSLAATKAFSH